jgi:hypothetical protein
MRTLPWARPAQEDRQPARRIAQLLRQIAKAIDVRCVQRLIFKPFKEAGQLHFILAVFRQKLCQGLTREIAKSRIVQIGPCRADNPQIRADQLVLMQGIKRWQQHPARKVAGSAEQQQGRAA